MYLVFDNNHHIRSLRKQPFLLALQRWGRCETSSATKSYHIRTMYIAFDNNYDIRTMYIVFNNMNALKSGIHVSPAWRLNQEMRRRLILQETWFTRWRFFTSYFIDVDTFYLFLNWFSTRVGDDQKYLSGSRLYACINTRKFKGLDSRETTSLPDIEKVIYMARHLNHRQKQITCSSKDSLAYSESLQHPTIAILLIKILFFSTT